MQLCVSRRNAIKIAFQVSLYPSHLLSTPATTKSKSQTHMREREGKREREYNHVVLVQQITKQTSSGFLALFKAVNMHTHTRA